jgi:iron complex outermembrane recepter protein
MRKQVVALGLILLGFVAQAQDQTQEAKAVSETRKEKEKNIDGVTIKKTKKAVEFKADRDVYDFSEQTNLNNSSAMAGLKKIPGVVTGKMIGFSYKGKKMVVYMDNLPLDTGGQEIDTYLEGLPAGLIEKVEFITNPGAEFAATGGDLILNIITSKKAANYLTASLLSSYEISTEPMTKHRTNNSINLNAKNGWLGWQLSAGQSYGESYFAQRINQVNEISNQMYNKNYFVKAGLIFNIDNDKFILNGRVSQSPGRYDILSREYPSLQPLAFSGDSKNESFSGQAIYQMRFDQEDRKLDFSYDTNYGKGRNKQMAGNDAALNFENKSQETSHEFKVDYSQNINLLESSTLKAGGLFDRQKMITAAQGFRNFDYLQQTSSAYAELQSKYHDFTFLAGLRSEAYQISGMFYNAGQSQGVGFDQHRLFPNAAIDYKINDTSNLKLSYNNKVILPDLQQLNPNNSWFKSQSFSFVGNPNLRPSPSHNYSLEYNLPFLNFTYSLSDYHNKAMMWAYSPTPERMMVGVKQIERYQAHNWSLNVPIMLEMFYKDKASLEKLNPEEMNTINLYMAYGRQEIADLANKNSWVFSASGQFNLPYLLAFSPNYFVARGNYETFDVNAMQQLNLTLTRKFLDKSLTVSVYANDVFNQNRILAAGTYQTPFVSTFDLKMNSRVYGLSINYTFKNKNKLAKVEENILEDNKAKKTGLF